jgi:hypothetical protein
MNAKDEVWFDVLAGKSSSDDSDPLVVVEAKMVRKALIIRRDAIAADAANVVDRGLDRIRERLISEGLMDCSS